MIAVLKRKRTESNTIGKLEVYNEENKTVLELRTLELPWFNNQKFISCIPAGFYTVKKYISPKFGECFQVQNVENRAFILFHPGNYTKNTKGCVLVGMSIGDINQDGNIDVLNSKQAMGKLLKTMPDEWKLYIHYEESN